MRKQRIDVQAQLHRLFQLEAKALAHVRPWPAQASAWPRSVSSYALMDSDCHTSHWRTCRKPWVRKAQMTVQLKMQGFAEEGMTSMACLQNETAKLP